MTETREEIRARLLWDGNVIENIQFRAYEIWILRGRVDGREAEDWALAENEVLNFLVEQELKKASEQALEIVEEVAAAENEGMNLVVSPEAEIAPEKKTRKRAASKATTPKTTTRKKAAASQEGEATETVARKTAAKTVAAKRTTTRKSSGKKSAKTEQPVVK